MIVVEVLGRRGEVVQQVRLAALPATIGRAWSSDVVLGDPTVDASHARIVAGENGELAIEDLGSVNGLHAGLSKERAARIVLDGVATVRVGRTLLRVARADQPVPAAVPDLAPTGRLAGLLASTRAMGAVFATGLLLALLLLWLSTWDADPAPKIMGQLVLIAAIVAAWAAVWAIIGRLRVQQSQFVRHHTVAWLALVALGVVSVLNGWLDFLWPSRAWIGGLVSLAFAAIAAGTIAAHLGLVSTAPRRRRLALALVIVGGLTGLVVLGANAARSGSSGSDVAITAELEPAPARMIPAGSVEDFVRATSEVKRKVDLQARD